ncbi:MAG: hypothetical protein ACLTDS_07595 [Bianqueaceae bacterium]
MTIIHGKGTARCARRFISILSGTLMLPRPPGAFGGRRSGVTIVEIKQH